MCCGAARRNRRHLLSWKTRERVAVGQKHGDDYDKPGETGRACAFVRVCTLPHQPPVPPLGPSPSFTHTHTTLSLSPTTVAVIARRDIDRSVPDCGRSPEQRRQRPGTQPERKKRKKKRKGRTRGPRNEFRLAHDDGAEEPRNEDRHAGRQPHYHKTVTFILPPATHASACTKAESVQRTLTFSVTPYTTREETPPSERNLVNMNHCS